jgi:hypothetical protein
LTGVYIATAIHDAGRRRALYEGDIFVLPPTSQSEALCRHARRVIGADGGAFAPHDPQRAQFHIPVEEWVARFAPAKPAFIHDPSTAGLIRDVLVGAGCDTDDTYMDVPRLRGVTSDGYLTSGVGYAHHPHRDTWYSAPLCQLNWWMPIYDFTADSAMAFHPRYWDRGLANGSASFNYYEWNAVQRKDAAKHVKSDTRKQPKAEEPVETEADLRLVCPAGGIIVFSAAQLHSTVPNRSGLTRFSLDFRTVNVRDLEAGIGAPNVDSAPSGTSLRDFVRCRDKAALASELIDRYDVGPRPAEGVLRFVPDVAEASVGRGAALSGSSREGGVSA